MFYFNKGILAFHYFESSCINVFGTYERSLYVINNIIAKCNHHLFLQTAYSWHIRTIIEIFSLTKSDDFLHILQSTCLPKVLLVLIIPRYAYTNHKTVSFLLKWCFDKIGV